MEFPRGNGNWINNNNRKSKAKAKANSNVSKMQVRSMIRNSIAAKQEHKFIQTTGTGLSVTTAGSLFDLCIIAQGDSDQDRNGDRVMPQDVFLRVVCTPADTNDSFRVVLFKWVPNTTPTANQVILTVGAAVATLSGTTTDNAQLAVILYDKLLFLSQASNSNDGVDLFLRLPKTAIQFVAGSTVGTNHIYLLLISDATTHVSATYSAKLRYTDS